MLFHQIKYLPITQHKDSRGYISIKCNIALGYLA